MLEKLITLDCDHVDDNFLCAFSKAAYRSFPLKITGSVESDIGDGSKMSIQFMDPLNLMMLRDMSEKMKLSKLMDLDSPNRGSIRYDDDGESVSRYIYRIMVTTDFFEFLKRLMGTILSECTDTLYDVIDRVPPEYFDDYVITSTKATCLMLKARLMKVPKIYMALELIYMQIGYVTLGAYEKEEDDFIKLIDKTIPEQRRGFR